MHVLARSLAWPAADSLACLPQQSKNPIRRRVRREPPLIKTMDPSSQLQAAGLNNEQNPGLNGQPSTPQPFEAAWQGATTTPAGFTPTGSYSYAQGTFPHPHSPIGVFPPPAAASSSEFFGAHAPAWSQPQQQAQSMTGATAGFAPKLLAITTRCHKHTTAVRHTLVRSMLVACPCSPCRCSMRSQGFTRRMHSQVQRLRSRWPPASICHQALRPCGRRWAQRWTRRRRIQGMLHRMGGSLPNCKGRRCRISRQPRHRISYEVQQKPHPPRITLGGTQYH